MKKLLLIPLLSIFTFVNASPQKSNTTCESTVVGKDDAVITESRKVYMNRKNSTDDKFTGFVFNLPKDIQQKAEYIIEVEADYSSCTAVIPAPWPLSGNTCWGNSGILRYTFKKDNFFQAYDTSSGGYSAIPQVGKSSELIALSNFNSLIKSDSRQAFNDYDYYFLTNSVHIWQMVVIRIQYWNGTEIIDLETCSDLTDRGNNPDPEPWEKWIKFVQNRPIITTFCGLFLLVLIYKIFRKGGKSVVYVPVGK